MLNKLKSDSYSWIFLIGAMLLLLEVTFFNHGLIFSLFVSGTMIYFGRKLYERSTGKLLFWVGLFFFISSIIGMMTFRLLLLAILLYVVIRFARSKKQPEMIRPTLEEPKPIVAESEVIVESSIFKNTMFGNQKTPQHVYEWNDINIITGIGDTMIDFSYTVLPKGETIVFIRHFIGNIKVFVPYDIEVNVRHSALIGESEILDFRKERSFDQMLSVKSADYEKADKKIKIFTSMVIGDIEVRRI
ncbi:cell wall-active antibiotics response protein LiaF [Bacillus sp. B15-48]|uniref:cell wall-active antibiotics response protein LiaF n=1 Tax=Bacillus sp. B15-48 TaxID=1548601 RepID=UPI001EF289DE|nr:cell wall-active antibiotics response protein LiaF [Bacillus sp. B15-48]